jgi:cyclohexyl-isocyanide hydratase
MSIDQPIEPLSIGMALFPNLTQLDLTAPYEVFSRIPNAKIHLLAATLGPVRSEQGLTIIPDTRFDAAPSLDILFVPGGPGINDMLEDTPFLSFLQEQGRQAKYVTSVCTGSLLLAAAGLLQGYRATTHWLSLDLLPLLGVQPVAERVVIDRNRITGGGITAGIDFGLVVAAEVCGAPAAQAIQLMLEYNPAPPFNSGSPTTADPALVASVAHARKAMQQTRREIVRRAAARLSAGASLATRAR